MDRIKVLQEVVNLNKTLVEKKVLLVEMLEQPKIFEEYPALANSLVTQAELLGNVIGLVNELYNKIEVMK